MLPLPLYITVHHSTSKLVSMNDQLNPPSDLSPPSLGQSSPSIALTLPPPLLSIYNIFPVNPPSPSSRPTNPPFDLSCSPSYRPFQDWAQRAIVKLPRSSFQGDVSAFAEKYITDPAARTAALALTEKDYQPVAEEAQRDDQSLIELQTFFGWGTEDVEIQISSMAAEGIEATISMGDDAPLAALSAFSHTLYDYFKQVQHAHAPHIISSSWSLHLLKPLYQPTLAHTLCHPLSPTLSTHPLPPSHPIFYDVSHSDLPK